MIRFTGTYTDLYELTMAQVYYYEGLYTKQATFDYFFRNLPYDGGFAIFCGLEDLLDILENLEFTKEDIDYLYSIGFKKEFLEYLKNFRFNGTIYSCYEGQIVFPLESVLQVEGNLVEAQIIETLLLNILNFETLIATKAARISYIAQNTSSCRFWFKTCSGSRWILCYKSYNGRWLSFY
ncbi:MAG: hypothetical protein KatS3mg129_1444 [Leptospiraceae bacterium]|nr:MAG: hypothetical protein KatS3mg129_1444 [Leptospiraceae bacterium]